MSTTNTEAAQKYAHNGNMSKSGRSSSTKVRVHAMQENTKKVRCHDTTIYPLCISILVFIETVIEIWST